MLKKINSFTVAALFFSFSVSAAIPKISEKKIKAHREYYRRAMRLKNIGDAAVRMAVIGAGAYWVYGRYIATPENHGAQSLNSAKDRQDSKDTNNQTTPTPFTLEEVNGLRGLITQQRDTSWSASIKNLGSSILTYAVIGTGVTLITNKLTRSLDYLTSIGDFDWFTGSQLNFKPYVTVHIPAGHGLLQVKQLGDIFAHLAYHAGIIDSARGVKSRRSSHSALELAAFSQKLIGQVERLVAFMDNRMEVLKNGAHQEMISRYHLTSKLLVEMTNELVAKLYEAIETGKVGNARTDVETYVAELERIFESLSFIDAQAHGA